MKPVISMIGVTVLVLAIGFYSVDATPVTACTDNNSPTGAAPISDNTIIVSNCTRPPCRFRRKSTVYAEFRFTPTKDIKTLKNEVHGIILGIPFPFLGVDGTTACNQIYLEDGNTKAPCPLKAGTPYVYKNSVKILEVYPKIKVVAHWALVAEDGSKPICFNVPAKITS